MADYFCGICGAGHDSQSDADACHTACLAIRKGQTLAAERAKAEAAAAAEKAKAAAAAKAAKKSPGKK